MAPADIRKEGSSYDLPLALGILAADEKVIKSDIESYILIGELSLDGTLQPVKGVLSISLGHNGVLFLDELPEFKRTVLEVMRQPLEDRVITISRAKSTVDNPASFILIILIAHLY